MSYSHCYDGILANAALMVLYASASHSIRVQLAITAKRSGQKLPAELLPMHSQWMSFIRAAHMASNAILNDIVDSVAPSQTDTTSPSPTTDTPNLHFSGSDVTVVLSPQDGPSENTKQLFLPLVASTYTQALKILRGEIEYTVASSEQQYPFTKGHQSLDVCFNSLLILETCASQAFSTKRTDRTDCDPKLDSLILKHIQKVSPWVGEYMISVTSMKSPRALRRTIMSFLNKVSGEFLTLIQSVLDSKFINTGTEDKMTPDSPDTDDLLSDSTCRLAMDIFAHWLVLVMLLDGVWWIGGIGEWELGQVIGLMKAQGSFHQSIDTGKGWWPESMYRVKLGPTSNL
jgi:hypothetical protein